MERKQLVVARLSKHWSQEQAAGFIGTDSASLSRWERGKSTPHPYNIQRLCEVYGKTAWELGLDAEQRILEAPLRSEERGVSMSAPSAWTLFEHDLTMRLLVLVMSSQRVSIADLDTLQRGITTLVEEMDRTMHTENAAYQMNRREALTRLASLPLLALGLHASGPVLNHPAEQVLTQTAAGITACSYLGKGGSADITLATNTLQAYLPTLKAIVKDSSRHRKAAAQLTTQDLLLLATLSVHNMGARHALSYAQDAMTYSTESQDVALQLIVAKRLAWIYSCNRQYHQAAHIALSAQHTLETTKTPVAPAIAWATYGGIAKFQAQDGKSEQALQAIEVSYAHAMKNDDGPLYGEHNWSTSFLDEGLTYYHLGKYEKALETYAKAIPLDTLAVKNTMSSERVRVEILNNQALASIRLPKVKRDKDLTVRLWKAGIEGATALQSEQRFSEALRVYDMMEAIWGDDRDVAELRPLTTHW